MEEQKEEVKIESFEDDFNVEMTIKNNSINNKKINLTPVKSKNNDNLSNNIKQKTISFLKNKYNIAFLIILFLAFLIRLKYIGQESIWVDAAHHLWYSIKLTRDPSFFFSSEFLTGDYVPIQILTSIIYLLIKNVFIAGKIVAMLFGLIGIVFMYLLGSELKNKFTGLISASLLGFNHLFWFYGVRPLADAPLTSIVILIMYSVLKLEKTKEIKWGVLTGFLFILSIFIKKQAIIFIFALIIYYLLFKRKELFNNRALFISWLIPVGSIFIASIFFKTNFLAQVYTMFTKAIGLSQQYSGLNAANKLPWIFSWYMLIPIIFGVLLVLLYKKKEYYFPLLFSFIYWMFFEVAIGTPEDRYILPLLPIGIIFFTFFTEELNLFVKMLLPKKEYVIKSLILLFVLFICWNFYDLGDSLIYNKSFSYGGHEEAGQWFKNNVPTNNTVIFMGSPIMQRVFYEQDFGGPLTPNKEFIKGGNIWFLRAGNYVINQTLFEEDLKKLSQTNDIYLEIDIWEYTQPKWYYPITQDSIDYFVSLGFQLVKVIEKEVPTQQGLQKMSVIFIFKKMK